jgi:hypothetical protein
MHFLFSNKNYRSALGMTKEGVEKRDYFFQLAECINRAF